VLDGPSDNQCLDLRTRLSEVDQLRAAYGRNGKASLVILHHQPLAREPHQGFTNWRLPSLERLSQRSHDKTFTGQQLSRDDSFF